MRHSCQQHYEVVPLDNAFPALICKHFHNHVNGAFIMRELTLEELELISGGANSEPWGPPIVVDGPGGDGGIVDWGGGDLGDSGGGGGGDDGDPSNDYPTTFDHVLDERIDQAAKSLANLMATKPNFDKIEYSAVLWKDASGNVHATDAFPGNTGTAPLNQAWAQVDFAHGGEVVGIIHSHPTVWNQGTEANPVWAPVLDSSYPSSQDFNNLMDVAANPQPGYDVDNYRSYIVSGQNVNEYYAFQQDPGMVHGGGQATWAVSSTDYTVNSSN